MSEIEALKKRISELEAEVAKLRAAPQYHIHYNYQQPAPQYIGPQWPTVPQVWCGNVGATVA